MVENNVPAIEVVSYFPSVTAKMLGRVYIFESGFESAYGGKIENAVRHYGEVVNSTPISDVEKFRYVHAIMWGEDEKEEKYIDFFGHFFNGNWKSNPDVFGWVTQNGSRGPRMRTDIEEITCGRGFRIIGSEEAYRLQTNNPKEYLEDSPQIPGLVSQHSPLDKESVKRIFREE